MVKWLFLFSMAVMYLSGCSSLSAQMANPALFVQEPVAKAAEPAAAVSCPVTQPFQDQPPDDPHADPFGFGNWHINADRTMWVGLPPDGSWSTGGEKVIWIRPAGTTLAISGQRLDAEAAPLRADIPCCYPTGFQVTGLHFPTEGCWEVIATAGDHELRFITQVENDSHPLAQEQPRQRGVDPSSPLAGSVLLQFCNSAVCELRPIDVSTGAITQGFEPIDLGSYSSYGVSGDLTMLAAIVQRNNATLRDGRLKFIDLATWEEITTTLSFDETYTAPVFSADKAHLIVMTQEPAPMHSVIHLVDTAGGKMLAERALDFFVMNVAFTPDGSSIMLLGEGDGQGTMYANPTSYVALLETATLETLWQAPVENLLSGVYMEEISANPHDGIWWQPAVVFAPDKPLLYIVHADQDQLTTIDFAQQRITSRAITQPLSWIERLLALTARTAHAKMANGVSKQAALSPDGTRLYVVGTHFSADGVEFSQSATGLQVIDVATARQTTQVELDAQSLSVEPVSGRLFLHGWNQEEGKTFTTEWTDVLDAQSYAVVTRFEGQAVAVASRLDGQPVLLSTAMLPTGRTELTAMDAETFEVLSTSAEWYRGYVGWVVLR